MAHFHDALKLSAVYRPQNLPSWSFLVGGHGLSLPQFNRSDKVVEEQSTLCYIFEVKYTSDLVTWTSCAVVAPCLPYFAANITDPTSFHAALFLAGQDRLVLQACQLSITRHNLKTQHRIAS